jgi:outer membrane protein OmpA-like peptidoglycan-associated protein
MRLCSIIVCLATLLLAGCASSDLSRNTAGQIDDAYQNGNKAFHPGGDIGDAYQNTSQTSKGMIIGGATGAVAGGLTSGIGALPGAAQGAIIGGALGAYIDAHTTLADKIINRGGKVIVLGDQVMIEFPSNRLFEDTTSNLTPYAYSTLDLVAELISGYPNMSVRVAAYTRSTDPAGVSRALSQQQADNIVRYMWRRGINTRMISAMGMGGIRPVSPDSWGWAFGENYRIEITLEKLPV